MPAPVLEVRSLSKRFALGVPANVSLTRLLRYGAHWAKAKIRGRRVRPLFAPPTDFWALKDISFEINPGEVLGIIGANGAGKSTLLKILSRILVPTEGEAVIRGRVSSLLEVGTGFNPNLSGRENVFLNASLHGLRRDEIVRRFDQIVEFSGVERFIDMPVKKYSSGMYSRLAFSVAAHLDPDVLFVDEVLAVGDIAFQKKCLSKFSEMVDGARTVLFVSHNLGAVSSICSKLLWLDKGQAAYFGGTEEGIARYYQSITPESQNLETRADRKGSGDLRFQNVLILDANLSPQERVLSGEPMAIALEYKINDPEIERFKELIVTISIKNDKGQRLFGLPSNVVQFKPNHLGNSGRFIAWIPRVPLIPGIYDIDIGCMVDRLTVDKVVSAKRILVGEGDFYGSGQQQPSTQMGDVLVDFSYTHEAGD